MKEDRVDGGTTMTGIRLRQESTLKDDEIEWEKKPAMLFLGCLPGGSLGRPRVDPVLTPDGVLVSLYFRKHRMR